MNAKNANEKLLTTDEHGYYGFNDNQFNPCLSVVRFASRPTTNCAAGLKRSDIFFWRKAASPTCVASGRHLEQWVDRFDEALERFGAKRHKYF
jgi:hypothetical protein